MSELKRMLVATDLSAPARHAAERAALICKETSAALDLLHVANLAPLERLRQLMGIAPAEMEQRILDAAREKLHALGASIQQRYGCTPATRVVAGALLTELAKDADGIAADVLVCGAKGESVVRHFALGATASRMLSTTTRPMLVVKQQPHEAYRRVLVPVDFSPYSLRAIQSARCIAPRAEIVLLHVFDMPFEGRLRYASVGEDIIQHYRTLTQQEATQKLTVLSDEAGLHPHNVRLVVLQGDPVMRIIEQEQDVDCDLIVMGKHGENTLERFLVGSVTKHVLVEAQGDVLVSV